MPNFSEWLDEVNHYDFQETESTIVSMLKRLCGEAFGDVNIFEDEPKSKPKRGFFDE